MSWAALPSLPASRPDQPGGCRMGVVGFQLFKVRVVCGGDPAVLRILFTFPVKKPIVKESQLEQNDNVQYSKILISILFLESNPKTEGDRKLWS